MLKDLEKAGVDKRSCTGRGQLVSDWKSILQTSAASLRRVPYYGNIHVLNYIIQNKYSPHLH